MSYTIVTETVAPIQIAAVRARVFIPEIASAWKPALDQVWAYLRQHPELSPGGNLFLYHHPTRREDPMDVDFGVEVARAFEDGGMVQMAQTPAGEIATTTHVGAYQGMAAAHKAIHEWCAANGKQIGGQSWEIYSDWNNDHAKLETKICYLLR